MLLSQVYYYHKKFAERQKYFVTDFFMSELGDSKNAKGTIFFYLDTEEYHLGNAFEMLSKNLNEFGEKYNTDTKNINIVYGGYREAPKLEFWIVPENAPDPIAKPTKKKVAELKN